MSRQSTTHQTPGRTVRVLWADAWDSDVPIKKEDLEEYHGPVMVSSLGVVLKDDEAGIMIAACKDDEGTYKQVLFVPRGMVMGIEVLRG